MSEVTAFGISERTLESKLKKLITSSAPQAIGVATAFLSTAGARKYDALTRLCKTKQSRVIAGISGAITHPSALEYLITRSHTVRMGKQNGGIFHPKLLVCGNNFNKAGEVTGANGLYIGSANFTNAGLVTNFEVGMTTKEQTAVQGAATAFGEFWKIGIDITEKNFSEYEKVFAKNINRRPISDLVLLGILDEKTKISKDTIVSTRTSNAVWAGLESFTGEHTFQVEFPKKAGEALRAILPTSDEHVLVKCSDGKQRNVLFKYYIENGMYRVNIPNDFPSVNWVRKNKKGALLIWESVEDEKTTVFAKILVGKEAEDAAERSSALGAIGHTSTRMYGWY